MGYYLGSSPLNTMPSVPPAAKELEPFAVIHPKWRSLGYCFDQAMLTFNIQVGQS